MVRRPLIAGNWKMHKTAAEATDLVQALRAGLRTDAVDTLVAPPYTSLSTVVEAAKGSPIAVAAQNMHWENHGAFTGEISPVMLTNLGCSHVILGHSERRQLFGETDEGVARKAAAALNHGLVPIICVGETLDEREADRTMEVVDRQVERALRELSPDAVAGSVLAYEPVWAIGTGKAATPEQAQEVHAHIRNLVFRSHGDPVAAALRILYGGSVKPGNVAAIMAQVDIDGALVGGACLEADSFLKLVHFGDA
jgi:triosephosphate isomerase